MNAFFYYIHQVELYTHVDAVKSIVRKLEKKMTLCTLNLVDSHYCSDPGILILFTQD
jgi:hypothetical protein